MTSHELRDRIQACAHAAGGRGTTPEEIITWSTMKAYVTKYLLTRGILEVEGAVDKQAPTMFVVSGPLNAPGVYFHGEDWHLTLEAAWERAGRMLARAEKRQQAKLARIRELQAAAAAGALPVTKFR